MSLEDRLDRFRADPEFAGCIAAEHVLPPRPARHGAFPPLDPRLLQALHACGVAAPWSHQAEAISAVLAGEDVAVVTGTASGKTLCYNVPVLERRLAEAGSTALYVFPTKALTQDQIQHLRALVAARELGTKCGTYDGDTPPEARRALAEGGDVVATNPYMLHSGILPNHGRWVRFFRGLRTIVVDEMHGYTGTFGSHVANVLRRLERVARHYGAKPNVVLCSATIRNPAELASALIGRPARVVADDGAPRGPRHYLFVNPPVVHRELGLRRNALDEARRAIGHFSPHGVKTIAFASSRNAVELLVKYLKDDWSRAGRDPARVRGYRGGYLPELRRELEHELREGLLDVVVATNALELGIDIGSLDLCVIAGYPAHRAAFFQQAGRAGRRAAAAAVVLVGRSLPLDQYVMARPRWLLAGPPEAAALDPDNLVIRASHLKCAAFELPFREGDVYGGDAADTREILDHLATEAGILRKAGGRYLWAGRPFPADAVSLNAADLDNVVIHDVDGKRVLAEIDRPSAQKMVHAGAIYQHQGEAWQVLALDWEGRRADARKVDVDYYTEANVEVDVAVLTVDRETILPRAGVARLCDVTVRKTVTMFQKLRYYTREDVGTGEVHLPSEELETEAFVLAVDEALAHESGLWIGGNGGALKGAASLLRHVAPLFVRASAADLGLATELRSGRFEAPALYLFDEVPGGVGLAETLYERRAEALTAARDVVLSCACEQGCPSCIGPGRGEGDVKLVAARLLGALAAAAAAEREDLPERAEGAKALEAGA